MSRLFAKPARIIVRVDVVPREQMLVSDTQLGCLRVYNRLGSGEGASEKGWHAGHQRGYFLSGTLCMSASPPHLFVYLLNH